MMCVSFIFSPGVCTEDALLVWCLRLTSGLGNPEANPELSQANEPLLVLLVQLKKAFFWMITNSGFGEEFV
jgi:hypothetical protein